MDKQLQAANILNAGGIIIHQTDTIFGLACLPNEKTLFRLAAIKRRSAQKGFILLCDNPESVSGYINYDDNHLGELAAKQKKPTTWLVPANLNIAPPLLGKTNKVAIRITSDPNIIKLCRQTGPIASTSANLSQLNPCETSAQARNMFGTLVDYIETKHSPSNSKPSTIIDIETNEVIRA